MNNPIFRIKKFKEPSLGSYLRSGRERLKLSIEELADQISVSKRHLEALEENDFSKLPPEIYVRGFIRRYCHSVDLDKAKAIYFFEKNKLAPKKDNPALSLVAHPWLTRMVSYRNMLIVVAVFFLSVAVFYLFKVLYPMYESPKLTLLGPGTCPFQTYQEKIELEGTVQPESKIWINDEEALVDKEGSFHCPVFLKEGENVVRFYVVNKFGKKKDQECTIYKN